MRGPLLLVLLVLSVMTSAKLKTSRFTCPPLPRFFCDISKKTEPDGNDDLPLRPVVLRTAADSRKKREMSMEGMAMQDLCAELIENNPTNPITPQTVASTFEPCDLGGSVGQGVMPPDYAELCFDVITVVRTCNEMRREMTAILETELWDDVDG